MKINKIYLNRTLVLFVLLSIILSISVFAVAKSSEGTTTKLTDLASGTGTPCNSIAHCKQIHQAWQQVSGVLGYGRTVFNPATRRWESFDNVYPSEDKGTTSIAPSQTLDSLYGQYLEARKMNEIYTEYGSFIATASKKSNIPEEIIVAIIWAESRGNPRAVSCTGAGGLMQLVVSTATDADAGLKVPDYKIVTNYDCDNKLREISRVGCNKADSSNCDWDNDERFNPEKNIHGGAKVLRSYLDNRAHGDMNKALDAYGGNNNYSGIISRLKNIAKLVISASKYPTVKDLCFPLTQESFSSDNDNWGNSRDGNSRCHAGNDFIQKAPGVVIAITDGIVKKIIPGWTTCEDGFGGTNGNKKGVSAVLIYHPSLGNTINYGEIDDDKVKVKVGDTVSKGQFLGVASYCDTFHLEVYTGEFFNTLQWDPPGALNDENHICARTELGSKPNAIEDPRQLISQFTGNFCEINTGNLVASQPETLSSTCTSHTTDVLSNSNRANTYTNKWLNALNKQNVYGTTIVRKFSSNGPNDNFRLDEKGRLTIIFVPCTTDFTKPLEVMYYFHGNNGFSDTYDFGNRLAPQIKKMIDKNRNFVFVFPELPWSQGDTNTKNARLGNTYLNNQDSSAIIWSPEDSDLVQLHADVMDTLKQKFNTINVGYVSMTGHSGGGSALKRAADVGALSSINVNKITFSDADYGWQGAGSSTLYVYNEYVKDHPNVELNMLVQDPTLALAHEPTCFSIDAIKQIGEKGWNTGSTVCSNWGDTLEQGYSTPGAEASNDGTKVFSPSNHPNINYVPISKGHLEIGAMSLAWEK